MRRDIDGSEAKRVARCFKVTLPRVGFEVSLGDGVWLASNGHFQFGFFDKPAGTKSFSVRCQHDACPALCPVKGA